LRPFKNTGHEQDGKSSTLYGSVAICSEVGNLIDLKEARMVSRKIESSRRAFLTNAGALLASGVVSRLASGKQDSVGSTAQRKQGKPMVIDCHAHVGISREPGTKEELSAPWDTEADPEIILQHARDAGIDRTVIFPIDNTNYKEANEEIAQICQRYPGRFIGYARHNAQTECGQIRSMLFHEIHDLGLRGLKLHEQPNTEILDAVKELGIPVLSDSNQHVELFEEFLPSYPTIDFIAAHSGSDQSADWRQHLVAIDLAKRYANVHLDTAAVVITEYLEKAIKELPAEQILFGSDEPEIDCRLEIFKIRVLNLPKEKEELILGGNILRLLGGHV
jgi:predicted TIM-barrel fold metal-dependent hydrolase